MTAIAMPTGTVSKMEVSAQDGPVRYALPLGEHRIELNGKLDTEFQLRYTGNIYCIHCGRKTKKSFNQGYCFPCMRKLAACDICIVKPELCHFDAGTCREPQWALAHCMQEHIVYLANSSGVKVGLTRVSQIPTRWMDQGAASALPIYRTQNRHQAGLLEVAIKAFVTDKTDWRRLLRGPAESIDLYAEREKIFSQMPRQEDELKTRFGESAVSRLDESEQTFEYPVLRYPEKIQSFNLDKIPDCGGRLLGIKGQYMLFDKGVINIRKYTGYELAVSSEA